MNLVAHALRGEGFDASEDGTGRGTPLVPAIVGQAMSAKWAKGSAGPAGPAGDEHHNLIPVPFDTTQITSPSNYSAPQSGDPCHPLAAGQHAIDLNIDKLVQRAPPVGHNVYRAAENRLRVHIVRKLGKTRALLKIERTVAA